MEIVIRNTDAAMKRIEFTSGSPAQAHTILSALGTFYYLDNVSVFAEDTLVYRGPSGTNEFELGIHALIPSEGTDDDE